MTIHDSPFIGQYRRRFLQTTAVVVAATTVRATSSQSADANPTALIDTNVFLGQWPFRRTAFAKTAELVTKLREQGVTHAWAGSFDALLHKDISSVNARLAEECKEFGEGLLTPMGALNPMLPGWEEDLRRCVESHRMSGIRLHPNYHGYKIDDPIFERVLQCVEKWNLLVQISVIMEEERTIHPLVNVPATDTTSLTTVIKKFPKVRLQLLNAFRTLRGVQVASLAANGVYFEIAMLEGVAGLEKLFEQVPLQSLCFGSYAPVFYFESARLKLQESVLARVQMNALCSENAMILLNQP